MTRSIQELGEFVKPGPTPQHIKTIRILSISASTLEELSVAVAKANERGWREMEFHQGIDPETGWNTTWLEKPVEVQN